MMLRQHGAFANQFRLVVTGRRADLRAAAGQTGLDLTVVIDAPIAATGQCAEAHFVTQSTSSDCRLLNSGHRLRVPDQVINEERLMALSRSTMLEQIALVLASMWTARSRRTPT